MRLLVIEHCWFPRKKITGWSTYIVHVLRLVQCHSDHKGPSRQASQRQNKSTCNPILQQIELSRDSLLFENRSQWGLFWSANTPWPRAFVTFGGHAYSVKDCKQTKDT